MAHTKLDKGIYFDDRCKNFPFFTSVMVRGQKFYKKTKSQGEAVEARDKFMKRMERVPTDLHPLILKQDGILVLEVNFQKYYADDEEGQSRAVKIANILDNLMDED